jgi:membrane protease YdiL (CAAX protease family)
VVFAGDPEDLAVLLNDTVLLFTLVATIMVQWLLFLVLFVATFREQTAWAISFLLAANLILAGLAWFLAQVGLPMPGEIALLIPQDTAGRIVWVVVSATAGFCEEIAFRGYLMTRLRILGKTKTWVMPVVVSSLAFGICHAYQGWPVSSLAFGICHAYQGWPGLILLTVYGFMFALLYLRTRSLWPCIIAHFFQDFTALFIPQ